MGTITLVMWLWLTMGNSWFCWCLLTYVGSILCILFAFSCIEKDQLQLVSTGFRRFYCISQTVRPATEKIQNQGNRNRRSGCIWLRLVRFRFFFRSMQLAGLADTRLDHCQIFLTAADWQIRPILEIRHILIADSWFVILSNKSRGFVINPDAES